MYRAADPNRSHFLRCMGATLVEHFDFLILKLFFVLVSTLTFVKPHLFSCPPPPLSNFEMEAKRRVVAALGGGGPGGSWTSQVLPEEGRGARPQGQRPRGHVGRPHRRPERHPSGRPPVRKWGQTGGGSRSIPVLASFPVYFCTDSSLSSGKFSPLPHSRLSVLGRPAAASAASIVPQDEAEERAQTPA